MIVSLGEILWDLLPTGKQVGGAPANVAYHLKRFGAEVFVVSSVGKDTLGADICDYMDKYGLEKEYLSIANKYPTGTVEVKLDDRGLPSYIIHENVAWDHIPWTAKLAQLSQDCDAVCFGTLAQRGQSHETIQKFLSFTCDDCLRIFDINLRQSYYTKELILVLLSMANVLKINDDELRVLAEMLDLRGVPQEQLRQLMISHDLHYAALTCGQKGSVMLSVEETVICDGRVVEVVDTVGAGDAFTAAMVMGLLKGMPLEIINSAACEIGAFVCTQPGAVPQIPLRLIEKLISNKCID